ncbi:hypothetical protein Y032_0025g1154 [Ancylostoma ceylanicum]|uniref:Uncharacterized protein n=1 Tax=Ancylostoma ceylanicum TaxID=53326 RepID=A0A016UWG3_9BILA|nr:hypothetical protein Y032_0025g1154 [Ancylostoma ceylanicum]
MASGERQERRKFRKEVGLVIAMIVECIVGAVMCIYETSFVLLVGNTNNLFIRWIHENFTICMLVVFSMNSYGIIFMSSDLRKEVVRFLKRMFRTIRYCGINKPGELNAFSTLTNSQSRDFISTRRIQNLFVLHSSFSRE